MVVRQHCSWDQTDCDSSGLLAAAAAVDDLPLVLSKKPGFIRAGVGDHGCTDRCCSSED